MFISNPIAIDLGNTNTCCYGLKNGVEFSIPSLRGGVLFPSAVYYRNDFYPYVGYGAHSCYRRGKSLVLNSKRMIGKSYSDLIHHENLDIFGVPVICGSNDQPYFDLSSVQEGMMKSAEHVVTDIFKYSLDNSKRFMEADINKVCIPVPYQFNENQRKSIVNALRNSSSSITEITVISEPSAAVLAYLKDRPHYNSHYLVFDFGGSTFDVSVVFVSDDAIKVCAYRGDSNLGGITIDRMVADWMKKLYEKETGRPFPSIDMNKKNNPRNNELKLLAIAEEVKLQLLFMDSAEYIIPLYGDEDELVFCIPRNQFNYIIRDIPHRILKVVDECILAAGIEKEDITDIVFVGGSTRIPLIQDAVRNHFPNTTELLFDIDPDVCIAKGALQTFITNMNILDRSTFTFEPVIDRNQKESTLSGDLGLHENVSHKLNVFVHPYVKELQSTRTIRKARMILSTVVVLLLICKNWIWIPIR